MEKSETDQCPIREIMGYIQEIIDSNNEMVAEIKKNNRELTENLSQSALELQKPS